MTTQIRAEKPLVTDPVYSWQPDAAAAAQTALWRFMTTCGQPVGTGSAVYHDFWRWSVEQKETFWSNLWDFCDVIGDKSGPVFVAGTSFKDSRFFPQAKINFAENLLRRRDDTVAIVFRDENKVERQLTFAGLYDRVSQLRQHLQSLGVTAGDRVAGFMPNMPETIIAMLATASLGGIWSSASPDFGVQGVLDRFGQIEPKVLITVDGYWYNGKQIDCREKLAEVIGRLPTLRQTLVVDYLGFDISALKGAARFEGTLASYQPQTIKFQRFDFNAPLYIMFSSGTTGIPKCIVHGQGGTLIQHLKEHRLQADVKRDDRVFYFTTCGWMMWNWLVTALASEATLLLYDGSPFYPSGYALFDYAADENCTLFGTSAKYIDALRTGDIDLRDGARDLSSVRLLTSTGSPLSAEGFDYIGSHLLPGVQVASISGGTDIVSCFVLGNPLAPVNRGEIQGAGLGMDVDIFDDNAQPMHSDKGELVCKTPFPCMPVAFWNDTDGEKYHNAYFARFDGIWCHGDWCEWTVNRGLIIHGRSDATLNPGGVRIGTAEIYRIVEQLPEIKESIAVGQDWDGDVRVVLFVVMQSGHALSDDLVARLKKVIREKASPRHVPAKVIAVADIPRTKSGKITELAVRDVIHGRTVKNVEALANADALALYKDLPELQN